MSGARGAVHRLGTFRGPRLMASRSIDGHNDIVNPSSSDASLT